MTRASPGIARLRKRIGLRGQALLVFGFVDFVFGFSLIDPTSRAQAAATPSYRAMQEVLPLAAWGWLWVTVGLVCTFHAFVRNDAAGFGAAIGIKAVWALALIGSWLIWDAPRAWAGAALWVSVACLVKVIAGWPEPVQASRPPR